MSLTLNFNNPDLYVDWVYELTKALYDPNIRYVMLKGGSGAGKSHVVAQLLLQNALSGRRIGAVRKYYSTIKASCFQLLCDYKRKWGLGSYIEDKPSIGELQTVKDGMIKMFGMDDEEKIKSLADYDWFWIEEANELTYDEFVQLDLRLRGKKNHKIICTFNPVSAQNWLKVEIKDNPEYAHNTVWIEKTARDNKFVDEQYLKTLESLKEKNPSKYRIYALNEWGEGLKGLIYPNFEVFNHNIEPEIIGLDFGYNHPTALTYIRRLDEGSPESLYAQEIIYKTELTAITLIQEMDANNVPKNIKIIADNARPEMIQQIKNAGYWIEPSTKGAGSVKEGIDKVLHFKLYLNGSNLVKEGHQYVWKLDRNGNSTDEPIKERDHGMDSIRYAVNELVGKKKKVFYFG